MNEEKKGTARLRAIVQNHADLGERDVVLPLEDALDLLEEVKQDVGRERLETAKLRANLGMGDENPEHYKGDGIVSCARAMRSMLAGWGRGDDVPFECAYWATCALKYLWRFPIKGRPREDLMKAVDCANKALDAWWE